MSKRHRRRNRKRTIAQVFVAEYEKYSPEWTPFFGVNSKQKSKKVKGKIA